MPSFEQGRQCEHAGCFRCTQEHKPYCSDHFDENAAARAVLDLLKRREEDIRGMRRGAFDPLGPLSQEMIELATSRPISIKRLTYKLTADLVIVRFCASRLERLGVLVVDRDRTGHIVRAMVKVGAILPTAQVSDPDVSTTEKARHDGGPSHHDTNKETRNGEEEQTRAHRQSEEGASSTEGGRRRAIRPQANEDLRSDATAQGCAQ